MNQTILIVLLSIAEIAILATAFSVFLYLRNRQLKRILNRIRASENKAADFSQYLQSAIADTTEKLQHCDATLSYMLEKRLLFLQSELEMLNQPRGKQNYWIELVKRLAKFIPLVSTEAKAVSNAVSYEAEEDFQGFIPTLEVSQSNNNSDDLDVLADDEPATSDYTPADIIFAQEQLRLANEKMQQLEQQNQQQVAKIRDLQRKVMAGKNQAVKKTSNAISAAANAMNKLKDGHELDNINQFIDITTEELASMDELMELDDFGLDDFGLDLDGEKPKKT